MQLIRKVAVVAARMLNTQSRVSTLRKRLVPQSWLRKLSIFSVFWLRWSFAESTENAPSTSFRKWRPQLAKQMLKGTARSRSGSRLL